MTPPARPQPAAGGRNTQRNGHGAKSEAVREKAVLALLSEATIAEAAKQCGVGERTLRRWLVEDPGFKAQHDAACTAMFQVGMSRVQSLMTRAIDTLEELLSAKKYPAVRLGAARTVVELATQRHEGNIIMCKLLELEAAHRQLKHERGR